VRIRSIRRVMTVGVLAGALLLPALRAEALTPADVFLSGLSSPKGLANAGPDLVVAQGAFGPPGPVLLYHGTAPGGTVDELTDPEGVIDVAISPLDGTGWALGGDGVLYHRFLDGTIVPIRNIPAYQANDPDPANQDEDPGESNPYGLAVLPNGNVLVADAANNDLLRVTPKGVTVTVARFDAELIRGKPSVMAEAVPTTVTLGPDGYIYVGELKGYPFKPGSSRIWRINPSAVGALCSATTADPNCSTYLTGLTAIEDIAFGPTGKLYVYELNAGGVGAYEAGFGTGDFGPAVLLEITGGTRRELAAGQLTEPGGVVVAPNGRAVFVTDHVMNENVGRLVRVQLGK
jgi:DNA-binding beta-propeller fold protein YncE